METPYSSEQEEGQMPFGRRRHTRGAPDSLQVPDDISHLDPRPHRLTGELLDWVIEAITNVLETDLGDHKSTRESLVRALKHADQLYPLTLEKHEDTLGEPERLVVETVAVDSWLSEGAHEE